TNQVHGSLFSYHINSATSARRYFLPANQGIPKYIENDFGGSIGGPIVKNKLFFFTSYEGDLISQFAANTNISVPTDAIKRGDLSASTNPIYDPATGDLLTGQGRTPFPGNVIPPNRISPITKKLTDLIPSPNLPGLINNFYVGTPVRNDLHRWDSKIDYTPGTKLRVNGRFGYQPYDVTRATVFGETLGGPNNNLQFGNVIATAASATYIFSPTFIVDGNFGLTRANQTLSPPSTEARLGSEFLGIPGTNLGDLPLAGGMPNFNVNSWTSYGYAYPFLNYIQPVYQTTGNATWLKGSHNIRFGVDASRQHMNHQEVRPTRFNFTGGATTIPGGPGANQFNSFGDFLLGLPFEHGNSLLTDDVVTLRTTILSFYVRDQWQVSRKFTVNAGLRWEYYPVPTRANRGIENLDLDSFTLQVCGLGNVPKNCGISVSKGLFSPRLGIAYRPTETFVIRAGYSLAPEQINMFRDALYNYPSRQDYTATGRNSFVAVAPLSFGIPVQPLIDFSAGTIPIPPGLNLSDQAAVIPKNFVRGYTQSWNLTLQKDFGAGWVAQAGYVGTHTLKQHTRFNVNYGLLGGGAASQAFAARGITGSLTVILPVEQMKYHSLQTSLQKRYANGFTMQANYTWSKWTGICCDDSGDGQPRILIPEYFRLNRALMPGDRTHNFRLSSIYEVPFGPGKSMLTRGVGSWILGGWQLNGLFSLYSGSPFSVTSASGVLNAPGNNQRADLVKSDVAIYGDPSSYFDPMAFAPVTGTPRFGTAGFNLLRGPGVANLDLSLFRNFRITERISARFSAEALNFSNTPHFSNPGGDVNAPTRNADGSIRALNGYTQITSTSAPSRTQDERFFRFGLRFAF
ncbi:MAG: TonB-dependent receptor, partial [Bryobacteraceae bacterium]|nr:TonB-dependent receptor [Bryobacteraceae bacterium]